MSNGRSDWFECRAWLGAWHGSWLGRMPIAPALIAVMILGVPVSANVVLAQTVGKSGGQSGGQTGADTSAAAKADAGVVALTQAMQIDKIIGVMRDEGLEYAKTLQDDMFPGPISRGWITEVEAIYDVEQMHRDFITALSGGLAGNPGLDAMTAFMDSPFGNRVVGLELAARQALLDTEAEDAARVAWLQLDDDDAPRAQQIERFVTVNDLLDSNVTGAMNSNISFYRGLMAGSPPGMAMTEEDILSSVSEQQSQIEADTSDWLYPYLTLAYQPLTDAELDAYIDFSGSVPGRDLNRALFAAFAAMFDRLSFELGAAAGRRMQGQDI